MPHGSTGPFTVQWLKALLEVSPYFINAGDEEAKLFTIDNTQRLRGILVRALEDKEPSDRFELFTLVLPEIIDLSLACDFFRSQIGDKHPEGATRERDSLYFGPATHALADQLLDRVKGLAASGGIWSQADPAQLLWFWWGRDKEKEVQSFLNSALLTKEGLQALLEITISLVRSNAGNYERVNRRSWSNVVDLDALVTQARELINSDVSDSDRDRARRFLAAMARDETAPF